MKLIRSLNPEEVECRVNQITAKGFTLLLYKNARADMEILDETFGVFGWECKYEVVKDNLYCTVRVMNPETGEWVSKQDVGVESNAEKEKGEASDAFKRACTKLGIGRELYTKIFIWINGGTEPAGNDQSGRPKYKLSNPFEVYSVAEMTVDENTNKITHLIITDRKGNIMFQTGRAVQPVAPSAPQQSYSPQPSVPEAPAPSQSADKCPSCGGAITAPEIGYSKKMYGAVLCRSCQAKVKNRAVPATQEVPEITPPAYYPDDDIQLPFDLDR